MGTVNLFVLDACALIAFLNDEKGADVVAGLFSRRQTVFMSALNVFEVCYDAARATGNDDVGTVLFQDIRTLLLILVEQIDAPLISSAIKFKTRHRMSVADAIALGLANIRGAALVTADHHEFESVEKSGAARFLWIR